MPPQFLADQLTLSQAAGWGRLCPPHYYVLPRIFRPASGPDLPAKDMTQKMVSSKIAFSEIALEISLNLHSKL